MMRKPWYVTLGVGAALVLAFAGSPSSADMIVTLTPRDETGEEVTGPVAPGERLSVDILLSVDGVDDPLSDIFQVQFDFTSTSATIGVVSFAWSTDLDVYEFRTPTLPVPAALTLCLTCPASVCQNCVTLLTLTNVPRRVATVDVIVTDAGTLNVVGGTGIGQVTQARIDSGFESLKMFWLSAGNLIGGTLDFSVQTEPPVDGGGSTGGDGTDGVVDPGGDGGAMGGDDPIPPSVDDPPTGDDVNPPGDPPIDNGDGNGGSNDPPVDDIGGNGSSNDPPVGDGDGAGDVGSPTVDDPTGGAGAPAFCGAAMMGTLLMTLLGLISLSIANHAGKRR